MQMDQKIYEAQQAEGGAAESEAADSGLSSNDEEFVALGQP